MEYDPNDPDYGGVVSALLQRCLPPMAGRAQHLQCYTVLKTKQRLSFWKKEDYYKTLHFEPRKGTALEASVGAGLTTSDKVSHRVKVGRFFSLKRGEAPILGLGVAHGRHAWIDTVFWFWVFIEKNWFDLICENTNSKRSDNAGF